MSVILALLGRNGSGKTTLLLLMESVIPNAGHVTTNGRLAYLRQLADLPQAPVLDAVRPPAPEEALHRLRDAEAALNSPTQEALTAYGAAEVGLTSSGLQDSYTAAMTDILVLGAGAGGLAAARDLAAAGYHVQILDKARGVSGRAATRRFEAFRIDHGARFLTARQPRTQALVSEGLAEGWLREWTRQFSRWHAGQVTAPDDGHPRYVGTAGMSDLGKALARGLEVHTGTLITHVQRNEAGWTLTAEDGRTFRARTLLLNAPAPQLAALLRGAVDTQMLDAVTFQPCWAVGASLTEDLPVGWPALRLDGHPSLDWIAREDTKRGGPPALMLHAGGGWSAAHLEDAPEQVQLELLQAAGEVVGRLSVQRAFAHRWRYATPQRRFAQACGWVPEVRVGWCGDWCTSDAHGPRLEAALLSGWALAQAVLATGTS